MRTLEETWQWARIDEDVQEELTPVDPSGVIGVLVAHNSEDFLAQTLTALTQLDAKPAKILAVNTGSSDNTLQILEKALDDGVIDHLISARDQTNFPNAVKMALISAGYLPHPEVTAKKRFSSLQDPESDLIKTDLGQLAELADEKVDQSSPETVVKPRRIAVEQSQDNQDVQSPEWLWLIHDDMEPTPRALEHLLRTGVEGVDVVVPGLLMPKLRRHADRFLAVGESISLSGRRIESPKQNVDTGDPDQNQLIQTDVLGGSTAGMLISWHAWTTLGGLDSGVDLFRDGIEFGWRANNAGFRVATSPESRIFHAQLGRWGDRESTLAADPDALDRQMAIRVLATQAKRPKLARARLIAGSFAGSLGYLIGKDLSRAKGFFNAGFAAMKDGPVIEQMRERAKANNATSVTSEKKLIPTKTQSFQASMGLIASAVADQIRFWTGYDSGSSVSIDDLTSDQFGGRHQNRHKISPLLICLFALIVFSVISAWKLFGSGKLVGPSLLPAPTGLGQAWQGWLQPNLGVPGTPSPWLGWMALGSTITFGQPDWFASLLILFSPALAGVAAIFFFRRIITRPWIVAMLGGFWAVVMVCLGISGSGSLTGVVAAILLPVIGLATIHWLSGDFIDFGRVRGPATIGFCGGILCSFIPAAWILLAVIALVGVIDQRDRWLGGLFITCGPILMNLGWLPALVDEPARLVTGADPATVAVARGATVWEVLFGRTNPVNPPWWISLIVLGSLWVMGLAFAGISFAAKKIRTVLLASALGSIVVAVIAGMQVVGHYEMYVRANTDLWLLAAALVFLSIIGVAVSHLIAETQEQPNKPSTIIKQVMAWGSLAAICMGTFWWLGSANNQLSRETSVLPAYVQSAVNSSRESRVLMVSVGSDHARWALTDANNPTWGSSEHDPAIQSSKPKTQLVELARQIAQGSPSVTLANDLTEIGVSHIWLQTNNPDLASAINNAQGLTGSAVAENCYVWTVGGVVSRYWIESAIENQAIAEGEIPSGLTGRKLIIAEPKDERLIVKMDGRQLNRIERDPWQQTFELPNQGGKLELSYRNASLIVGIEILVALTLVIVAAPSVQRSANPRRAL